jgi:hypothetical protein
MGADPWIAEEFGHVHTIHSSRGLARLLFNLPLLESNMTIEISPLRICRSTPLKV